MLNIILRLKLKSLKAQLQYPLNFLIGVFGTSCIGAADILLLLIPAKAFQRIGGWNFWELGFMFSFAFMAYYPTHYFFQLDAQIYSGVFPYLTPLMAIVSFSIAFGFSGLSVCDITRVHERRFARRSFIEISA
jgi:ABC-type uncharacterized transport system permease subunit